jgi:ribosome biogenesis GTPase
MSKKRKVRTDFRKNRGVRTRPADLTRAFDPVSFDPDEQEREERIGRTELNRRRTVMVDASPAEGDEAGEVRPNVDQTVCRPGRVLRVMGLLSDVADQDGRCHRCGTRRLLKTLASDDRHIVVAGDRVWFRPEDNGQGLIERIEPRHGVLSRNSRGRRHVIVANVDRLVIVSSAAEPRIKPGLIDRFLVAAEQARIRPLICINKIDLVEPADLAPLVGVYSQMGYEVLLTSIVTGQGLDRLRRRLAGQASAVAGQSGVGKSSLLNAVEPGLDLRIGEVSRENEKGKHTTTTAQLLPLAAGGYVVDTPGLRQFQLWDVTAEEIAGCFRDLRPFINHCRYPSCTHTHEAECAVKDAVADDLLDERRYESYCKLFAGDMD